MPNDQDSEAFLKSSAKVYLDASRAFPDDNNMSPPACYKQCVEAGYKSPNGEVANISDANQY